MVFRQAINPSYALRSSHQVAALESYAAGVPHSSPLTVVREPKRGHSTFGIAPSRPRDAELVANCAGRRVLDFAMSWHCGAPAIGSIAIDGVTAAFAIEDASMPLKMANKIATFHQASTSTDKVSQMAPPGASFAAFSR